MFQTGEGTQETAIQELSPLIGGMKTLVEAIYIVLMIEG